MLGTTLWQYTKIITSLKNPKGLKDLECEKGLLSSRPPIAYVLPRNLLQTKDNAESLKVKLPDGTMYTMVIISKGNTEYYLAHVIAVLCLINQKGLDV
jgi:hypothetical protein